MIWYRKGYKYQLARAHKEQLTFAPEFPFAAEWFHLGRGGVLEVFAGYAWDGPERADH